MKDYTAIFAQGKGINYFATPNQRRERIKRYLDRPDNFGNKIELQSIKPEGDAHLRLIDAINYNKRNAKQIRNNKTIKKPRGERAST